MLEELKDLGLTEYEIRVYRTLLVLGTAKGGDISKTSKVPHGKTYLALHTLADKGLITIIPEKPKLFRALPPKQGINRFLEDKKREIDGIGESVIKSLRNVKQRPKEEVHERVQVVLGFEKMFKLYVNYANTAEKEMLVFSVGEKIPNYVKKTIRNLVKKKLDCKFIATKFDDENRGILKEFQQKIGWEMRHYPGGKFTFSVTDSRYVLINVRNPENREDRISIFFESKDMGKSMREYFYMMWKKAKPIML
jgi:sugar-specific transcriptional regulator TrmB